MRPDPPQPLHGPFDGLSSLRLRPLAILFGPLSSTLPKALFAWERDCKSRHPAVPQTPVALVRQARADMSDHAQSDTRPFETLCKTQSLCGHARRQHWIHDVPWPEIRSFGVRLSPARFSHHYFSRTEMRPAPNALAQLESHL